MVGFWFLARRVTHERSKADNADELLFRFSSSCVGSPAHERGVGCAPDHSLSVDMGCSGSMNSFVGLKLKAMM